MSLLAQMFVGAPGWTLPAVILGLVLVALVVFVYVRQPALAWVRGLAACLKIAAIVMLAFCLFEPLVSGQRPKMPQANVVGLLADNSESMTIHAPGQPQSRGETMLAALDDQSVWRARLAQDFDVRTYRFDTRLQHADDLTELTLDGATSALQGALESFAQRYQRRPVASVLLFTDGNSMEANIDAVSWDRLGFPVYPVISATGSPPVDARIDTVTVTQTNFEAAPVTISAQIRCLGMANEKLVVQLVDALDQVVEEQTIVAAEDERAADVRFQFRPPASRVQFLRVTVFPESDRESFAAGQSTTEVTLANNVRVAAVNPLRGPYRVLYVAGRPNWEFKFLRRALQEDPEVELVGLVRIAREEPKFSFGDRVVDSANPLFEGFDREQDDARQYDEPVLLRFGIEDQTELADGFPSVPAELFAYDAIILDDLEASFFSQDQMLLLRQFVAARGGGLLMLGGQESFANGGYADTPLGDLCPTYLRRRTDAGGVDKTPQRYQWQLTREGWLQPWMRLRETESSENRRLAKMPMFATVSRTNEIKPGASLLVAAITADGESAPGLVVQRYGKGQAAAMLFGDMWRWAMHREDVESDDLPQAWRQMLRWLVSDVPRRVQVNLAAPYEPGKPVVLEVAAADPEFLPVENAQLKLSVTGPDGKTYPVTATASEELPGTYQAEFWPKQNGGYQVDVAVMGADGSEIGTTQMGWTCHPTAAEYQQLRVHRDRLESIATQTDGKVITFDELPEFARELPHRRVPVTETWVYPFWHQPWVLMTIVLCLCGEWGLRRWKGLP